MKTLVADVRFAAARDADALAAVHEASWRGAYSGLIPHRALNGMIARRGAPWWRRAIASEAAILVLDYDGGTAGYATLGHNRTAALVGEGEIFELYLLPQFQGLGFGRHLFEASRRLLLARNLSGLVVWALEENSGALAFYERMGGRDVATGTERFEGAALSKTAFAWS